MVLRLRVATVAATVVVAAGREQRSGDERDQE